MDNKTQTIDKIMLELQSNSLDYVPLITTMTMRDLLLHVYQLGQSDPIPTDTDQTDS